MANAFYMDASALAKRYVPEPGSELVDAILDNVPARRFNVLNVGLGEVVSILVRKGIRPQQNYGGRAFTHPLPPALRGRGRGEGDSGLRLAAHCKLKIQD